MNIGRVSKPLVVKWLMIKSSSDSVNDIIKPLRTPGRIEGSSTKKKDLRGVQPRSIAASGR